MTFELTIKIGTQWKISQNAKWNVILIVATAATAPASIATADAICSCDQFDKLSLFVQFKNQTI